MKKITNYLILLLLLIMAGSNYSNAQCVASFSINDNQYSGLVQFSDSSIATNGDTIHTYSWNFGDGVTANVKNPVHFYPIAGNYSVSLTVTDGTSSASTIQPLLITPASPQGCASNGYWYVYDTTLFATITFSDNNGDIIPTNDSIVSVLWDFGDGNTSTLFNPTHTFANDTLYNVVRTFTTANGCISNAIGYQVHSTPCNVTISFNLNPTDTTKFDLIIGNTAGNDSIRVQGIGSATGGVYQLLPLSEYSNNNHTFQAQPNTM